MVVMIELGTKGITSCFFMKWFFVNMSYQFDYLVVNIWVGYKDVSELVLVLDPAVAHPKEKPYKYILANLQIYPVFSSINIT